MIILMRHSLTLILIVYGLVPLGVGLRIGRLNHRLVLKLRRLTHRLGLIRLMHAWLLPSGRVWLVVGCCH